MFFSEGIYSIGCIQSYHFSEFEMTAVTALQGGGIRQAMTFRKLYFMTQFYIHVT